MKKHRPEFIAQLASKEDKERLAEQLDVWRKSEVVGLMVKYYEKVLDKLILEDEKDNPLSWFQFRWGKAKRVGKREALRKIINDLKE